MYRKFIFVNKSTQARIADAAETGTTLLSLNDLFKSATTRATENTINAETVTPDGNLNSKAMVKNTVKPITANGRDIVITI
ncbi:MAG: hypothetical protein IKK63_01990 [Clostridia bacterium]|nr:hypothetical protein [Clostridia bacterium]MBR3819920.1 hypothetical protein [Clostridia bacterium]